jgi:hypothetical protein
MEGQLERHGSSRWRRRVWSRLVPMLSLLQERSTTWASMQALLFLKAAADSSSKLLAPSMLATIAR